MTLNNEIVNHNASVLFYRESDNFTIDKSGKLSPISNWNVIGRLVKWVMDLNGSITKEVDRVVKETLETIVNTNMKANEGNADKQLFYLKLGEAKPVHVPAFSLVERIKSNSHFSQKEDIGRYTEMLLNQKEMYPKFNHRNLMRNVYTTSKDPYNPENYASRTDLERRIGLDYSDKKNLIHKVYEKYPDFKTNPAIRKSAEQEYKQEYQKLIETKIKESNSDISLKDFERAPLPKIEPKQPKAPLDLKEQLPSEAESPLESTVESEAELEILVAGFDQKEFAPPSTFKDDDEDNFPLGGMHKNLQSSYTTITSLRGQLSPQESMQLYNRTKEEEVVGERVREIFDDSDNKSAQEALKEILNTLDAKYPDWKTNQDVRKFYFEEFLKEIEAKIG